jgi:hypothetical protein
LPRCTASYTTSASAEQVEYDSVLAAWNDYLAHDNDGGVQRLLRAGAPRRPAVSTPWVQFDDQYRAACVDSGGSAMLRVTPINGGSPLITAPSAAWGLHVDDPNLALGNLVALVQSQAAVYRKANPASS